MTYKSFIIGLIIILAGLGIFVAFQSGLLSTEKLLPAQTQEDSTYCKIDTDCKPYCGFSRENMGRGKCFNKESVFGEKFDQNLSICGREYEAECNSCLCESGVCTTVGSGDFLC